MNPSKTVLKLLAGLAASAFVVAASAQDAGVCGPLQGPGQYGPFDYRTITAEVRHRVEDYHFTPDVQALRKGASGPVAGDIDYTLRVFPNNPRALLAMTRASNKQKTERPLGARYTTECYFDRAIRFTPDDPMPRVLYANYLRDRKRIPEVKKQLEEASRLRGEPSNFDFDYNLGLLYYDVGDYDNAVVAAKRAYELGAPLPALRDKLKAAGKWKD